MKLKHHLKYALCLMLAVGGLSGCSEKIEATDLNNSVSSSVFEQTSTGEYFSSDYIDVANLFSDRDYETSYTEANCDVITLSDNGSSSSKSTASINGNVVTISKEGTYLISGSLSDGQIVVDVADTEKVQLVLDGVSINSASSAPIYIKTADKVFVTTTSNSQNILSTSGEFVNIDDNNIDGVIFSKEDLTLNGAGTLTLSTEYGHGIVCKDDLVITSGSYTVSSTGHAISANDSVRIADGSFTLNSQKDAIHSENNDDAQLGYIYIADGDFNITAETDGFDAAIALQIDGGEFKIVTGGGSANASTDTSGGQNKNWGAWGKGGNATTATTETTTEETASAKALKADGSIFVNNGSFHIDSSDDSIHSNENVTISTASFGISSGDDGIHADSSVLIYSGTINIEKSYEGIEGQSIDIYGGNIEIIASDDGLNAAGGNDASAMGGRPGQGTFNSSSSAYINIEGGLINITANGDGIDSNGNVTVSDGEIYVNGTTNGADAFLDYDGTATITGGIFVGTGGSSMVQNFGTDSTQASMLVSVGSQETGVITVLSSDGTEILSFQPTKTYSTAVISTPELTVGESYTINLGGQTQTIELDSIIYGTGGGGMRGGNKVAPDGTTQPTGERPQRPTGETADGTQTPPDQPTDATTQAPQGESTRPEDGTMPQGERTRPEDGTMPTDGTMPQGEKPERGAGKQAPDQTTTAQ